MKAIILAAGCGTRLNLQYPKCLINVNNKNLLDKLVGKLQALGVNDISVVVGFQLEQIKNQVVKYYTNEDWYNTEECASLLSAKQEMNDDIIVLPSDIIIPKAVLKKVIKSKSNIAIVTRKGIFFKVVKFKKKVCDAIKILRNNGDTLQQLITLLVGLKKYKVDRIEVKKEAKIIDIDTVEDLNVVRKKIGEVSL